MRIIRLSCTLILVLKTNPQATVEIPKVAPQDPDAVAPDFLHQVLDLRCDALGRKSIVLVYLLGRKTLSKAVHRHRSIRIALPSVRRVRLDHDRGLSSARLQN